MSAKKDYRRRHAKQLDKTTEIEIIKAELEEKQFKVKLTVIDTPVSELDFVQLFVFCLYVHLGIR